jgi:glycylpeptide N-tetradecanoyltransferase
MLTGPQVTQLLSDYLARYELAPAFSEEEVLHYLLPVEGVIDSYVVVDSGARPL